MNGGGDIKTTMWTRDNCPILYTLRFHQLRIVTMYDLFRNNCCWLFLFKQQHPFWLTLIFRFFAFSLAPYYCYLLGTFSPSIHHDTELMFFHTPHTCAPERERERDKQCVLYKPSYLALQVFYYIAPYMVFLQSVIYNSSCVYGICLPLFSPSFMHVFHVS